MSNIFSSTSTGISDRQFVHKFPGSNKRNFSFPSPFFDLANQHMPRNIKDLLRWVEHIYLTNTIVSQCIKRTVQYPITDLQYEEDDEDVTSKMDYIFKDVLDLRTFCALVGTDRYVYGNSFVSVFFPFERILKCESCRLETPIARSINLEYKDMNFVATCRCGVRSSMKYEDRRSLDISRTNLIRWDPKQIDIKYNPITGESTYYYTLPADIVNRINAGDAQLCSGLPKAFLEASKKNRVIKLNKDFIFHLKTDSLAGLSQEWGIPTVFCTFKLHYHNAILRRANEAIALDYLVPIRFIHPMSGGADNASVLNMGKYKDAILSAIEQHRVDPGDAYFIPVPVGYQAVGGEAKALAVDGEIKATNEEIMNAMGFPQEFFYGSITVQAAPVALRMLENSMSGWVHGMNSLTQWIVDKVTRYFSLPKVKTSWAKVTLIDDLEKKNMLMQLVGAQKIADETLLNSIGTTYSEEVKKKFKQQKLETEEGLKAQQELQRIQESYQQENGGGTTPQDIQGQAVQLAQQWLQMDEGQRRQSMDQMAKENETIYAVAKEVMERLRRQQGDQPVQGQ